MKSMISTIQSFFEKQSSTFLSKIHINFYFKHKLGIDKKTKLYSCIHDEMKNI